MSPGPSKRHSITVLDRWCGTLLCSVGSRVKGGENYRDTKLAHSHKVGLAPLSALHKAGWNAAMVAQIKHNQKVAMVALQALPKASWNRDMAAPKTHSHKVGLTPLSALHKAGR